MALLHWLLNFSRKYTVLIPIAVVSTICFFQFQTAFIHIIMASFLTWLGRLGSFLTQFGRFAFFGLIITQCCFLSAYLAKYEGTSNWYLMVFSFGPAVFVWIIFLLFDALYLGCLFRIWGLYIVALVVNIAMVFGKVGDRIDKNEFLGPNVLKMVLCITPLLLLLLLNTGDLDDSDDEEERLFPSCVCPWPNTQSIQYSNDHVGVAQYIGISLANGRNQTYQRGAGNSCLYRIMPQYCSILLASPWQMAEIKRTKEGPEIRVCTASCRNIVQIVFVNLPFLVIRAVVFFKFGKDESIFIAKNGIAIILSILEIRNLLRLRRVRQEDQVE